MHLIIGYLDIVYLIIRLFNIIEIITILSELT